MLGAEATAELRTEQEATKATRDNGESMNSQTASPSASLKIAMLALIFSVVNVSCYRAYPPVKPIGFLARPYGLAVWTAAVGLHVREQRTMSTTSARSTMKKGGRAALFNIGLRTRIAQPNRANCGTHI